MEIADEAGASLFSDEVTIGQSIPPLSPFRTNAAAGSTRCFFSRVRSTSGFRRPLVFLRRGPYTHFTHQFSRGQPGRAQIQSESHVSFNCTPLWIQLGISATCSSVMDSTREVASGRQPARFLLLFSATHAPHLTRFYRSDSQSDFSIVVRNLQSEGDLRLSLLRCGRRPYLAAEKESGHATRPGSGSASLFTHVVSA